ncbi:MAG: hypothetical protein OEV42_09975 [Deltaproteobacteria bacterium]|nr:hypothetical protein [Deltaproteobacteria bacterium]
METRTLIIEKENGWGIFDALKGDTLMEGLSDMEETLKLCRKRHYEMPYRVKNGQFLKDLDGEFLYLTEGGKSGNLELEYADGTPCLDFEACPHCKSPAFGRYRDGHNCYYCPACEKDVDCVPPEEWIGAAD